MILADTCIWIDFFRKNDGGFSELLKTGKIVSHWIVIGELASGNLPQRVRTLADLRNLPRVARATERETLALIENRSLYGCGLSWNDLQLLASALVNHTPLWTYHRQLNAVANDLGTSYSP